MSAGSRRGHSIAARLLSPRARLVALIALLVSAFVMGGGSRADIQSLIFLRPAAFLLLAYAIAAGEWADVRRNAGFWTFALVVLGIALLHLVPLPPALWQTLPGRDIVAQVDALTGLGEVSRPLALNITDATNALVSLVVPLAALALVSIQRSDWFRASLAAVLALGAVSMLLATLQLLGPPDGPFYTYRITNGSSPVGLFANRNHNAMFMAGLLPVLAVFGAGGRAPHRGRRDWRPLRRAVAWLGGVLAVTFVVMSGSRAGLLLAALMIALIPFVLGIPVRQLLLPPAAPLRSATQRPSRGARALRHWRLAGAAMAGVALALVLLFGRLGNAVERLGAEGDNRSEMWAASFPLVGKYFPWGSGIGSYVDVFKRDEPHALLGERYVNHAHNDVLELAITVGLPGMILMGIFLMFVAGWGLELWHGRKDTSFDARRRRLGFAFLVLLPLASLIDYPLRTPAMMVLFVIAAAWMTRSRPSPAAPARGAKPSGAG